jgi:hypothetical protein
MHGILPLLGGLIMYAAGIYSLQSDWVASNSYTSWTLPGLQWHIGGIFLIALAAALAGPAGLHLHAGDRARVLQEADPDPGHLDPRARAVAPPLTGPGPQSLPALRARRIPAVTPSTLGDLNL